MCLYSGGTQPFGHRAACMFAAQMQERTGPFDQADERVGVLCHRPDHRPDTLGRSR